MLQSDTNGTGLPQTHRARPNAAIRRNAPDDAQNVDYIRKELSRLAKMARHMQRRELAHFIDVAVEVAGEIHGPGGKTRNT